MNDSGQRIVLDLDFEAALGEVSRAIRDEQLEVIARIDVRDQFWRDLGRDFRQYFLLEAWSPDLACEALRQRLDVGASLPTIFAVYELADGETAVVVQERLGQFTADADRRAAPLLASAANREIDRVARVMARLERASSRRAPAVPAA